MLLLSVALYFFFACLLSWLALLPSGRDFSAQAKSRVVPGASRRVARLVHAFADMSAKYGRILAVYLRGTAGFFGRNYLPCTLGAAIIILPPALALIAGQRHTLGGYDVSTREMNSQVAELLQGEQLAPPAPLPPLIFATQEAQQQRPMLVSASRNWYLLNADYAQRLLLVFKIMKEKHGYDMAILEGYRSPQRQNMLASMGSGVTSAAAFQSWHQYGLAADCAFLRDGKLVISEKDPWAMRAYQLYGEVAESVGMTWGGRWKMMDFGHTELRLPGVMKGHGTGAGPTPRGQPTQSS